MNEINWDERALQSEIEFSRALGGEPLEYPTFIHLYNKAVPWGGDFNRVVGVRISDFASFDQIVKQVEQIHQEKNLEKPDRYDIYPPALDVRVWRDHLSPMDFLLGTSLFFCAPTVEDELPSEFALYSPPEDEYIEWYHSQQKSIGYDTVEPFEEYFQKLRPLRLSFIRVFKPYWLLKNDTFVGWVYCAHSGEYCRLFEVEIEEKFRGRGFGRLLLEAIRIEGRRKGASFILLRTSERLRTFYENAGFQECTSNSIIRLKK